MFTRADQLKIWQELSMSMMYHLIMANFLIKLWDRTQVRLKKFVQTSAPHNNNPSFLDHYKLGNAAVKTQSYPEAEYHYRILLSQIIAPLVEADICYRLAEVLEAQYRTGEAEAELSRAEIASSKGSGFDSLSLQSRILRRQNRYKEAIPVFEAILETPQSQEGTRRAAAMFSLGMTAFDAGQLELAAHWMEQVIASSAQQEVVCGAHTMSGIIYGDVGRFEEADRHLRQATLISETVGNKALMGSAISMTAGQQRRHGNIVKALQIGQQIERQQLTSTSWFAVKSECFLAEGQYEESRSALYSAQDFVNSTEKNNPYGRKRQQGTISLGLARTLSQEGHGEPAWRQLQEAIYALKGDDKLIFYCECTSPRILALMGQHEEALMGIKRLEQRKNEFSDNIPRYRNCLFGIAQTYFTLAQYAESEAVWRVYITKNPDPIDAPVAFYHLGECLRHQGEREDAGEAYRQAITVPIAGQAEGLCVDSYAARLARQRLEEKA